MKAVVISRFGGPEVLEVRVLPEPQPTPGEVVVKVEAVGINFADTMTTRGVYQGMPEPPSSPDASLPAWSKAPESGHGLHAMGSAAEKIVMKPSLLWPQPQGWSSEQSAAFPVNFLTAYLRTGRRPDR